MDQDILDSVKLIISYIDEYNNGKEENIVVVKKIIKDLKRLSFIGYKKYYIYYKIIIKFFDSSTKLYNSPILNEPMYHELISECYSLADAYKYYMNILYDYIKEIIKSKDYENLSIAYYLSVKNQTILNMINEMIDTINNMERYQSRCITIEYPEDYLAKKEKGIIEIDKLSKILRKKQNQTN